MSNQEIRSKKTKEAFIKYLEEHPEERFWQAIRNFADVDTVYVKELDTEEGIKLEDTFYREEL